MEVYADVIFAVNFVMDFFILWAAGKLSRLKAGFGRLCLGAFIMSLAYCVCVIAAPANSYVNLCAFALILLAGVTAAFRPRGVRALATAMAVTCACAFTLGGIGSALYNFAPYAGHFSVRILVVSSCVFYTAVKLAQRWYNRFVVKKQAFYPVKIFLGGHNVLLTALLDTGNTLKDPVSNAPVIVAEFGAVKQFLPDTVRLIFYENNEDNLPYILENISQTSFSGRLRMIPFASLGERHGLLLGFRPDKVEIENDGDVVTFKDVIVGIYNCRLTGDGAYQGLLNPELIS